MSSLSTTGALVTLRTAASGGRVGRVADAIHRDLTGGRERLRLRYEPGFDLGRPASPDFQMPIKLDVPIPRHVRAGTSRLPLFARNWPRGAMKRSRAA